MPPVKVHMQTAEGVDIYMDFASLEVADVTIKKLLAEGYKPVAPAPPPSNGNGHAPRPPVVAHGPLALVSGQAPEPPPFCPKHGKRLKPRVRYGESWHSHRVETSEGTRWCRGYATGKPDDGFLVC